MTVQLREFEHYVKPFYRIYTYTYFGLTTSRFTFAKNFEEERFYETNDE